MGDDRLATKFECAIEALRDLQTLDDGERIDGALVTGRASMAEDALRSHRARLAQLEAVAEAAEASKNGAYSERDRIVAALSKLLPAWLERHPEHEEWEDDWRWIVFIDGPTGQMTWHIHDSELPWFDHLTRSAAHRWDGHTTAEKYQRLAALRDGGDDGK